MRHYFYTYHLFFTLIFLINLTAQESTQDPFSGNYELRNSKEIIFSGVSDNYFTQRVFDYLNFPGAGDSLVGGPFDILSSDSLEIASYNSNWYDMDAGNFFGDGSEEVVTAWKNRNDAVSLLVSSIDPFSRQWQSEFYAESDSGLLAIEWPVSEFGCIRVVTGNFDQDPQDEIVLAYWGATLNTIKMVLYDADSTTNFQVKATIEDQPIFDEYLMVEAYQYPWFDLCAADLNNDGLDEIVLTGVEPANSSWDAFIQIYNYDVDASSFKKQAKKVIFTSGESDFDTPYPIRIALGSGHFTDVDRMDCVVGVWAVDSSNAFAYDVDQNLIHIQIDSSLTKITFKRHFSKYLEEPESSKFGFAAGDLNRDGLDYLFLLQRKHILIFRVHEDLTLEQLYDYNEQYHYYGFSASSPHNLVIANIDTALTYDKGSPEIIFYEYIYFPYFPYGKNRLSVFEIELDSLGTVLGLNMKAMKDNFLDDGFYPNLMIAANLDMDDIHLGTPKLFQKTEIVQPIVVLNAPPIHYDILDGTPYDLSYAYNENDCQFFSRYQKQSETSIEVSTEVMKSWTTSKTLNSSFSAYNISIGVSLSEKYGKNFSKVTGSSHTVTIQVATDAVVDDRIYATIVDYKLWEYPAFAGNTPIGHILVVEPVAVKNQWFPSKSSVATTYIPNHEVGNILSYKEYPELFNNDEVASLIKGSYGLSFTLDENSSYDWALTFNDFSTSGTSTSNTVTREIGGSVGIYGISAGVSDSYTKSNTQTHKISVAQNLSLQVHLDKIDQTIGIGEVYYTVTPYAYWAKSGALVIDYAVKPELAEPGYPLTWWQDNYGNEPDPAFILPWRYDKQKGFDPAAEKIYQTKEILFTPSEPKLGEVVTISARVQNYSLFHMIDPVKVRFYIGNPDSGGTAITGVDGKTDVFTEDVLQPRSDTYVYLDWKIPPDLEQFPRIYAVIDPDNEMTEIHEDNNMGFSVLGKFTIPTDIATPEETIPISFELKQNYPNPFNPATNIEYQLSKSCSVNLSIYNILGQRVATLVSEKQPGGIYSITWDASRFASGLYFYRLVTGQFMSTRKMLYLK